MSTADPLSALRAKTAADAAPQPDASAQQAAPQQTAPDQDNDAQASDEETVASEGVNLHRAFSRLQEAVTSLLDNLGIKRSGTIKHIDDETMAAHLQAVHQALQPVGGVTKNMLTVGHTIHGSGETVAHPSEKLRQVIVPAKYEPAVRAIAACRAFVSKAESLIGETPEVKVAKSQLALIGRQGGSGMTAFDLAGALLSVPSPVIKVLAKKHSAHKHGGKILAHLTGADTRS
jgi:hypothetical protein